MVVGRKPGYDQEARKVILMAEQKFDARRVRDTGMTKNEYRKAAAGAGYEARYSGRQRRWFLTKRGTDATAKQ